MYQKRPDKIFPMTNFVFSHYGHCGPRGPRMVVSGFYTSLEGRGAGRVGAREVRRQEEICRASAPEYSWNILGFCCLRLALWCPLQLNTSLRRFRHKTIRSHSQHSPYRQGEPCENMPQKSVRPFAQSLFNTIPPPGSSLISIRIELSPSVAQTPNPDSPRPNHNFN